MCSTCGCGDADVRVTSVGSDGHHHDHHAPPHDHAHPHDDSHGRSAEDRPGGGRTVVLEAQLLAKNDLGAERNREWLARRSVLALNVMSSPGSGKTTVLERTIRELDREVGVIEGDQETLIDAERIRSAGARAVQINTGAGCHLDAEMLERGLSQLDPASRSLVFIENVGNLVCPALFDLGEAARVVVMSVTEGADKPYKYPHMFATADLVILNKIDLLPYVDFDTEAFSVAARRVRPGVEIVALSAKSGEGMAPWYEWLAKAALIPKGS